MVVVVVAPRVDQMAGMAQACVQALVQALAAVEDADFGWHSERDGHLQRPDR